MKAAPLLRRLLLALAVFMAPFVAVALLLPPTLYFYGLSSVSLPPHRTHLASLTDQRCAWASVERTNDFSVQSMTPWTPFYRLLSGQSPSVRAPGETAAGVVALDYVYTHAPRMPNLKWHITTAAVHVWLSRHATAPELATQLVPLVAQTPKARRHSDCDLTPNPSFQRTVPGHSPGHRR